LATSVAKVVGATSSTDFLVILYADTSFWSYFSWIEPRIPKENLYKQSGDVFTGWTSFLLSNWHWRCSS